MEKVAKDLFDFAEEFVKPGDAYIAFKENRTGGVGGTFEKTFHFFMLNQQEYLAHYHRRSNVEGTFFAIKRKFGDSVMSKNPNAMVNEALCQILGHNLTYLIQEQETLGIIPIFLQDEEPEGGPEPNSERMILPFARLATSESNLQRKRVESCMVQ